MDLPQGFCETPTPAILLPSNWGKPSTFPCWQNPPKLNQKWRAGCAQLLRAVPRVSSTSAPPKGTDLVDEISHKPKCCGPLSLTVKNLESRPPPLLPLERQDKETRWAQNTKESGAHPRIDVLQPIKVGQIHSHFWETEVNARSGRNAWHTFIHVRASRACCKAACLTSEKPLRV